MNSADLTKKLIEFESVKEKPQELKRIIDFCENYLKGSGHIKRFKIKGKHSLVATFQKTKKPFLFILAHADVVEAEKSQFVPKVRNGKLFGRGSSDMKSGLAVSLNLFKEFSQRKNDFSLGLIITTDEEIGGELGAGYLVNKKGYSCNAAFASEPSKFCIPLKRKGCVRVKVSCKGKAAHSAYPEKGENAIIKLIDVYKKIEAMLPKKNYSKHWKPSINLAAINAGKAANIIPDFAEMIIDFRLTEDIIAKDFVKKLKKIKNAKIEVLLEENAADFSKNNKFIPILKKISESVLRKKVKLIHKPGGADTMYFSHKGIPCVEIGLNDFNEHGLNEYCKVEDIIKLEEIIGKFIEKTAGVK